MDLHPGMTSQRDGPAVHGRLRAVGPEEGHRTASLLDLDPDLAQGLDPVVARAALQTLLVRVSQLPQGRWDAAAHRHADPGDLGLLIVDGLLMRELLTDDVAATELIGPGDVVRPWRVVEETRLLEPQVRWSALGPTRVALLDRRVARMLGNFPEIGSLLAERMSDRSSRLAVCQAIAHLNRIDQRLMTLFWHLAERWGRMTREGVLIGLALSHRVLAQLVGARRPTVSTTLRELTARGALARRPDGSWILTGEPVGRPTDQTAEFVPVRRRVVTVPV